ncbi:MAG TPA: HEAT repeat domain-containing protein [Polyangia bacterium]|nr:HEAT repeat domain-containing protein [Polyangia bacterium]
MPAATVPVLFALALTAAPFGWPGALETDGRALADSAAPHPSDLDPRRLAAIDRLVADHGREAATPFLVPLLTDRDPAVRLYAARLLARAGVPAATAVATSWIASPAVREVDRVFGLYVLQNAATLSSAARTIVEQAVRDSEPSVRRSALDVLAAHPIGPSLQVVLAALDDDDREVRLRAVQLAGTCGDPRATPPLLERLDDVDRQVRLQAIVALASLHDLRAVPAFLRLTGDGTLEQRIAAIDALGTLPAIVSAPTLIALARRPADEVGRHALLALGGIATPAAIGALVAVLRSPPVPDEALVGLRQAGTAAVPALIAELRGGTPSSSTLAAKLLGELGDRRASLPLVAALEHDAPGGPIALAALAALMRLADPVAVPALVRAAESTQVEIRRAAFEALRAGADPRSEAVLEEGLADADALVRALAARLAGAIDAHAAAPALSARLSDANPVVRKAVAAALAHVTDRAHHPLATILSALTRPDVPPFTDQEVADIGVALESIATPPDVEPLARALLTARGGARGAIAQGLAAAHSGSPLTERATIDALIAAVADGGVAALSAADALAGARVVTGAVPALARAFADAESTVRARLCPAVAAAPDGDLWLAAVLADPHEPANVRAAAAWAARGLGRVRPALEAAAHGGDDAVATNARAALAVASRSATTFVGARLRGPDGDPLIGRWVTIGIAGGPSVRAMTDSLGVARVAGLPDGAPILQMPGLTPRAAP